MGEWLIGDVSFSGVHIQTWMLLVSAFFPFWFPLRLETTAIVSLCDVS
jgi:hypothetical protein